MRYQYSGSGKPQPLYHESQKWGEGYVALYATPNPFLLNKICLN